MLYSIKNREELENQVDEIRLQDKLGKQNLYEKLKNLYERFTNTIRDTSQDTTNTITETSTKKNQAISGLNEKVLKLMKDKGMIPP